MDGASGPDPEPVLQRLDPGRGRGDLLPEPRARLRVGEQALVAAPRGGRRRVEQEVDARRDRPRRRMRSRRRCGRVQSVGDDHTVEAEVAAQQPGHDRRRETAGRPDGSSSGYDAFDTITSFTPAAIALRNGSSRTRRTLTA